MNLFILYHNCKSLKVTIQLFTVSFIFIPSLVKLYLCYTAPNYLIFLDYSLTTTTPKQVPYISTSWLCGSSSNFDLYYKCLQGSWEEWRAPVQLSILGSCPEGGGGAGLGYGIILTKLKGKWWVLSSFQINYIILNKRV